MLDSELPDEAGNFHHGFAPDSEAADSEDTRASVADTVSALIDEGKAAARAELSLVQAVIQFVTGYAVQATVWLTAAAMLGLIGIVAIAVVGVLALNKVIGLLPSVGIVAGTLILAAAVCVMIGRSKIHAIRRALAEIGS